MKPNYCIRHIAIIVIGINCIVFPFCHSKSKKENCITAAATDAKAACVMEQSTRRILYESCGDSRLPIASTTKIATAITVLESCQDIEEKVEIPSIAEGIEGSSVYLKKGEIYTVKDLLYGLMLRSGNDCAVALADSCGGMRQFIKKMNITAQKAGAFHTNFHNPHGLPHKKHYSTAHDLCLIACYALQNHIFREIVSTQYYEARHWKNKNKMLYQYEGAMGVKTGYTKEAGRCLVSAAQREGMALVCTVLNSPNMYEYSMELLDDAFHHYHNYKVVDKNEYFSIPNNEKIKGYTKKDIFYPFLLEEVPFIHRKVVPVNYAVSPDENGQIVGQIQIYLSKCLIFSENLYKL